MQTTRREATAGMGSVRAPRRRADAPRRPGALLRLARGSDPHARTVPAGPTPESEAAGAPRTRGPVFHHQAVEALKAAAAVIAIHDGAGDERARQLIDQASRRLRAAALVVVLLPLVVATSCDGAPTAAPTVADLLDIPTTPTATPRVSFE